MVIIKLIVVSFLAVRRVSIASKHSIAYRLEL